MFDARHDAGNYLRRQIVEFLSRFNEIATHASFAVLGGAYAFLAPVMADRASHWAGLESVLGHFENNIPSVPSADEDDRFLGLYLAIGRFPVRANLGVGGLVHQPQLDARNRSRIRARRGYARGRGGQLRHSGGVFSRHANPFAVTAVYAIEIAMLSWLCAWVSGRFAVHGR